MPACGPCIYRLSHTATPVPGGYARLVQQGTLQALPVAGDSQTAAPVLPLL
jgi:hypothetical protein